MRLDVPFALSIRTFPIFQGLTHALEGVQDVQNELTNLRLPFGRINHRPFLVGLESLNLLSCFVRGESTKTHQGQTVKGHKPKGN